LRAKRGKENPSTSISISTPKKEKRCIKEGTWSQEQQCHPPLPSTDHSSATNPPSFLHQPPRTPKKKNKKRMNTIIKLLEKNKTVMN
jgi:hypothetical protein